MYYYRFKTNDEFIKEFGIRWEHTITYSWYRPCMDILLGRKLSDFMDDWHINDLIKHSETEIIVNNRHIILTTQMIKKQQEKPTKPSYKPKVIKRQI